MPDFRKLHVWQSAEALTVDVFRIAKKIRNQNLSNQLVRAAMSVPTNIVEGNAHVSPRERARFLGYALASLWEVEGHVQLSRDLEMISQDDYESLQQQLVDVRKMLYGLIKKVRSWDSGAPPRPAR
jgi:four helix bundle protein